MRKEIENWWKQAERDLVTAENSCRSGDYYASVFWCQQAVEKALKAKYIQLRNNLLKIHDLVKLAKEIQAPEEMVQKCSKINPVYFEVRYPEGDELPSERVNQAEAKKIINFSKEILEWIKKNL